MSSFAADELKHYINLLESLSNEASVGMNPTNALSDKELDRFQQMSPTKKKIATADQQADLDAETFDRNMDEEFTDEGNQFSGARKAAIDAGEDEFTVDGHTYTVTGDDELSEGMDDNFTIDDIRNIEQLPDLEAMKIAAKNLIATPSHRPIKPQKLTWLMQAIDAKTSSNSLIKLMYDLLLGGEGHSVIGSRHSTNPNNYRAKFGGQNFEEGVTTNQFEEPKKHADHTPPDWSKAGTTAQNYSKGQTKKWDSYMSNESTDSDLSEGMDPTDPKHIKMAQAAQEFLRMYGKHIESSQDYGTEDISALKALAHYTATRPQIRHALEVLKSQSPYYDRQAHYGWHGDSDQEVFRKDMHGVTTETLGTTDDDYTSAEQDAWDAKGSNENMDWDETTLETARDFAKKWSSTQSINESSTVNKRARSHEKQDATNLARLRTLAGIKQ